jgi:hypothetical protein
MDQKALIERRTQLERRRDAELRACGAKWRSRINSVDLLLRAAATADDLASQTKPGQASPAGVPANSLERNGKRDRKEGAMEVVRQTLEQNQGFFTARMLVEFINKTKPISVTARGIGRPLRSLCKLGEIRLVEKGNGRKPQMYLKF